MADTITKANPSESYELMTRLFSVMCEKDSATLIGTIRNAGVDVNAANPDGRTLLMFAVYYASRYKSAQRPRLVEAIRCLLQNGADVNLANARGVTAFGLALAFQQKDILQLLFTYGATFPSKIH